MAVAEHHVGAGRVETEDLVIGPAIVRRLPVARGGAISPGTRVVVVDDLEARGRRILGRVAGNAETIILLSPPPEPASQERGSLNGGIDTDAQSRGHVQ